MNAEWLTGRLCSGHGVASGRSNESPYPNGTIRMQAPVFKALGLDLSGCYFGTLNIDFAAAQGHSRRSLWRELIHDSVYSERA